MQQKHAWIIVVDLNFYIRGYWIIEVNTESKCTQSTRHIYLSQLDEVSLKKI